MSQIASSLSGLVNSTVTNVGSMTIQEQVALALQALALIQAVMPALQNVVTELQSKDDLLTKIQQVVADVEHEPAVLVGQIQQFFANLTGQGQSAVVPPAPAS